MSRLTKKTLKHTKRTLKNRYAVVLSGQGCNNYRVINDTFTLVSKENERCCGIFDDNDGKGYTKKQLAKWFDNFCDIERTFDWRNKKDPYRWWFWTAKILDCNTRWDGEIPSWFKGNGWYCRIDDGDNYELQRLIGELSYDDGDGLYWSYMSLEEVNDRTDGIYNIYLEEKKDKNSGGKKCNCGENLLSVMEPFENQKKQGYSLAVEDNDGNVWWLPWSYDIKIDLGNKTYLQNDSYSRGAQSLWKKCPLPTLQELIEEKKILKEWRPYKECDWHISDHTEEKPSIPAIMTWFKEQGYNVTEEAISHNWDAWKSDFKSGFRDEKNGYHLFTPCGHNPLRFSLSTLHESCEDWQQTYIA